jgi:hypothetical protein
VIFLDADICIAAGVTDDDGGFNISLHLYTCLFERLAMQRVCV